MTTTVPDTYEEFEAATDFPSHMSDMYGCSAQRLQYLQGEAYKLECKLGEKCTKKFIKFKNAKLDGEPKDAEKLFKELQELHLLKAAAAAYHWKIGKVIGEKLSK